MSKEKLRRIPADPPMVRALNFMTRPVIIVAVLIIKATTNKIGNMLKTEKKAAQADSHTILPATIHTYPTTRSI